MVSRKSNNSTFSESTKKIRLNGYDIPWYDLDTTTSTMDEAQKLLKSECPFWTVITAKYQSSGRGTHGRNWSSHPGKGLWMSVIMPLPRYTGNLSGLTLLAADALIDTLEMYYDSSFSIKYPNDIIVNNRKIAGILAESATKGEQIQSIILGIGVNFRQTPEDFMNENLSEATSLFIETGSVPERVIFLEAFLSNLKHRYELVESEFADGDTYFH